MKLEFNITKGKFWVLVALLVISVAALVYAKSVNVNPGHSTDEIEGLEEKIKASTLSTIRDSFEKVDVDEDKLHSGDDGKGDVPAQCPTGKKAIGCSIYKNTNAVNGDAAFCRINDDENGCLFDWDVEDKWDGSASAHCYCI